MNKKSSLLGILKMVGWILMAGTFAGALFGVFKLNSIIYDEDIAHGEMTYGTARIRASQSRIIADLAILELARRDSQPAAEMLKGLASATDRGTSLFKSYTTGGEVKAPTGHITKLRVIATEKGIGAAQDLQAIWFPLENKIQTLLKIGEPIDEAILSESLTYAKDNQAKIDKISEVLAQEEEIYYHQRVDRVRWYRSLLVGYLTAVAVLLIPVIFLMNSIRKSHAQLEENSKLLKENNEQLAESARKIEEAKRESDTIMETVQQGLLLIDSKGIIGGQYAKELERIFRMENLTGFNFLNILQRILTEKMYNTTRDYITLMFDAKRKEKQILKVNPLDVVEVNFSNPEGGFITKYLGFTFRRIIENGVVDRVFIGVSDITSRVTLERELRASELKKEKQFDLLLGILHIDPHQVEEFLQMAKKDLQQITDTLRAEDFAAVSGRKIEELRERLNVVFRCVHNIKGNSAYLKLSYFQKTSEDFESKINQLRNRPALTGDDFLSIVIAQSDLRNDIEELDEIRKKLGDLRDSGGVAADLFAQDKKRLAGDKNGANGKGEGHSEDELVRGIRDLATTIAGKTGKSIRVDAPGFKSENFRNEFRPLLRDVLIQLTRNSLAHSIEVPEERSRHGKAREALIQIKPQTNPENGFNGFVFVDDGRGLDVQKIKQRAISQGLLTQEQAADADESSLAMLIFTPGFSTADEVTSDAGRGMGMDIIKEKIIDECGGEITVEVEPGRSCSFGIYLPN